MNQSYIDIARMIARVAPFVFADQTFALKGGTAINLFLRDMPRLSVDLDLVFPDYTIPRDEALARIAVRLQKAEEGLKARGFETRTSASGVSETKLMVRRDGVEVKIEVNSVMRGTLYPVQRASLTEAAKALLQADVEVPLVSMEDVYGGKLVAAMDRQHPRDLFDVLQLFAHEGITPNIRKAFVVYLASHNRPVHEVLFPNLRDINLDYERTFNGMTAEPVPLANLLAARDELVRQLHQGLEDNEREFLVSIVRNRPEWSLMGFSHLQQLPGLRWKLQNLSQLQRSNPKKFAAQAEILVQKFS